MPRAPETMEETRERWDACIAMGIPKQQRFVVCAIHGERGSVAGVYHLNNWIRTEDGIRCEPSHPYCFSWCDRPAHREAAR